MEDVRVSACQALAVLLQHPALAADQQIVCSLLQVCKAWRAAAQQSAGGLTNIVVRANSHRLSVLSSMGTWLSNYPSLVRTISISHVSYDILLSEHEIIRAVLELSLRLAALGGGPRAACSTPEVAAQHVWRLQSYHCDVWATPAMLAAFPAATLTRLSLSGRQEADTLAGPLKRLSNLANLSLCPKAQYTTAAVLEAIGTLTQLTSLSLSTAADLVHLQQLPVQLQQLTVTFAQAGTVDLSHLAKLKQLDVNAKDHIQPGSVLPAQLQHLTVFYYFNDPVDLLGITNLQQLRCLTINSPVTDPSQLRSLAAMSQLQELHLHKQPGNEYSEVHSAPSLSSLTMLRSLGVFADRSDLADPFVEACRLAASASSITKLVLSLYHSTPDDLDNGDVVERVCLCEHLKGLTQLQHLDLTLSDADGLGVGYGRLAELDLLHLTALTGLTYLSIAAAGGLDNTAVCAVATVLRHLQHLSPKARC